MTIDKWALVELTGIPYKYWRVYRKGKSIVIHIEAPIRLPHTFELFYYDRILRGTNRNKR